MRSISSSRADRNRIGTSEDFRISGRLPARRIPACRCRARSGRPVAAETGQRLLAVARLGHVMPAFFSATRMTSRMWQSSSTMRMRCATSSLRRLCQARGRTFPRRPAALEPPAAEVPAPPGRHPASPFSTTRSRRAPGMGPAPRSGMRLVDGRQRLRPELEEVVDVDGDAFARRFATVADIIGRDDRREVHQRAAIEHGRRGRSVGADEPSVGRSSAIRATIRTRPSATSPIQMKAATRQ